MIKVLIITGLLPIQEIKAKKRENDILLETEDYLKKQNTNIYFKYLFLLPYTNKILSKLSKKWLTYFQLQTKKKYTLRGRNISILGIVLFPKKLFFRNVYFDISLFYRRKYISKIIKEFNPNIIHAHSTDSEAYIARKISKKYKIPYIITLREIDVFVDSIIISNLKSAKALIAISPIQKEVALQLVTKNINLVPHGISESFFIDNSNIFKNGDPIKLIVVCRLLKLKNIDIIIKSLSNFNSNFIFDIYGDGPEKEDLLLLVESLQLSDKIKFKGFIPNNQLPMILPNYNLFIMPSFPEALGRVYFEAMACGLPVIASKNTGIDGIIENGREGFLIESENEVELQQVLLKIIKVPDTISNMSSNAKKTASKFRWEKICGKLITIYDNAKLE